MNKLMLLGNLTRDPETTVSGGTTYTHFSLAVHRKIKREGSAEADFFNCTAFGSTAEFIEKHFKKGSRVAICGRIENDNYTNKNGEKVYAVQVIVEEVDFAEKVSNTK